MKGAPALVIGIIWLIVIMMVGFIVTANLEAHANDSEQLVGDAATNWTNFMVFVWISFGILAMTPLISIIGIFAGLFGGGREL